MIKRRFLIALFCLLTTGLTLGDKVVLNDGTEIEGTVVSEDAESYEVEVQVTATIKDLKRIQKADVKSVVRTSPEDIAFKAIEGLVPTPDRLTPGDYNNLINKQVKAFTDAFPKTKHKRRIEAILAILEREQEYAKAGGLKLDGKWIEPDERAANAYDLDARLAYADMVANADQKNYKQALRDFESFESDFTASAAYPKAVESAKQILLDYRPIVARGVKRADKHVETRKTELERLPSNQRSAALAEIKRRSELYAKVLKQEKDRRTKWLTLEQYHRAPMEEVLRNIQGEIKRLDALVIDETKQAGPIYQEAWTAATAGDDPAAQKLFSSLQSLRVPDRYIESLKTRLAETLEAKAAAAAAAATPGTDDPDPDEDAPDGEDDDKTASSDDASTSDAGTDSEPPVMDEEEDEGLSMTTLLMIVMVVVLLIAGVAVFTGKKK